MMLLSILCVVVVLLFTGVSLASSKYVKMAEKLINLYEIDGKVSYVFDMVEFDRKGVFRVMDFISASVKETLQYDLCIDEDELKIFMTFYSLVD